VDRFFCKKIQHAQSLHRWWYTPDTLFHGL
jgi:hypothetical protein